MSKENKRFCIMGLVVIAIGLAFLLGEYYGRPKCDDLVRDKYNGQLVCEYGLGDVQEDNTNVIMKGEGLL